MINSGTVRRRRPTRAQTRERVLTAAASVFAERGYDQASLGDIAAVAGLTKGAIYSSFGSKDELFYALMRDQIGERLRNIMGSVGSHKTLSDLARDTGRVLTDATIGQPEWHLTFIEFWTRAMRNPALRNDFVTQRRAARDAIAARLEEQATQLGVTLPLPAAQLAIALLALSNGLAIEQLLDPEGTDHALLPTLLEALVSVPQDR